MQVKAPPSSVDDDGRVSLVFRVGVTGHRWMSADDEAARLVVGEALDEAFARCSNRSTAWTSVEKAVVSSLAEGADRLAAEWALERGIRLEAVLPMQPEAYLADFPTEASRTRFWRLIDAAAPVTVVPPQDTREDAYSTAGDAVVERSDVLLAVWDGRPTRGKAGTGEVVATARRSGVPVSWVRAEEHPGGRPTYRLAAGRDEAVEGLRSVPDRAGPLSDPAFDLLDAYNRTALPQRPAKPLGATADPIAPELSGPYHRADLVAVRARNAMLRASRALYTLAVVAVATSAGQLVFLPHEKWPGWVEFAALLLIMGILITGRRTRLLDRWISTRTLAERLRSGYYLAAIGASPALGTTHPDVEAPTGATEWADRAAQEVFLRTAARTPAHVDLGAARALLLGHWIDPQVRYHRQVEKTARRKEHLSDRVTVALFGVSLLASLLHNVRAFTWEGAPEYWTFLSVVVPAAAAAVSGYTAHRAYVHQRLRAARMGRRLTEVRGSVVRAATMAELRRAAEAVDLVMQGESADWLAATRLHELRIP
jgi:hypothetical protein